MWELKKVYKQTYLQNRNRLTDIESKLQVTKGERELYICIYTHIYDTESLCYTPETNTTL